MSQDHAEQRPRHYASLRSLAARWGVTPMVLSRRSQRGMMLEPDVFIGDQPGWDVERASAWWKQQNHTPGRPRKKET